MGVRCSGYGKLLVARARAIISAENRKTHRPAYKLSRRYGANNGTAKNKCGYYYIIILYTISFVRSYPYHVHGPRGRVNRCLLLFRNFGENARFPSFRENRERFTNIIITVIIVTALNTSRI